MWATDAGNNAVALSQAKTFSFNVDVSGDSSITPQSVVEPAPPSFWSSAASARPLDVGVRSTQNVIFCPKGALSACADSDWRESACDAAKGCTMAGNTLKNTAASAFGTYALCDPACSLPPPTVGGGSSSGSNGLSLSNGAIAAIVLVPVISLCLIGAALLIRRGMIFNNIAAFGFLRPEAPNNTHPPANHLPDTHPPANHLPPSRPAPPLPSARQGARQINIAGAAAAAAAVGRSEVALNMQSAPAASAAERPRHNPPSRAAPGPMSARLKPVPPPVASLPPQGDAAPAIEDTAAVLNPRAPTLTNPVPRGPFPDAQPSAPAVDEIDPLPHSGELSHAAESDGSSGDLHPGISRAAPPPTPQSTAAAVPAATLSHSPSPPHPTKSSSCHPKSPAAPSATLTSELAERFSQLQKGRASKAAAARDDSKV